ncbi:hypothetical protein KJ628_00125 [Patescibacteria group bacterium]|nr:hypothetical protein [Patescibacteria group bacterium]
MVDSPDVNCIKEVAKIAAQESLRSVARIAEVVVALIFFIFVYRIL